MIFEINLLKNLIKGHKFQPTVQSMSAECFLYGKLTLQLTFHLGTTIAATTTITSNSSNNNKWNLGVKTVETSCHVPQIV